MYYSIAPNTSSLQVLHSKPLFWSWRYLARLKSIVCCNSLIFWVLRRWSLKSVLWRSCRHPFGPPLFLTKRFYHHDLMHPLKNFYTRRSVGSFKSVSNRAPHLLTPALRKTISVRHGDAIASPTVENWPLFKQTFSTFGKIIQLHLHLRWCPFSHHRQILWWDYFAVLLCLWWQNRHCF